MALQIPFGKKRQFAAQQLFIVVWQYAGAGGALPFDERIERSDEEWLSGIQTGGLQWIWSIFQRRKILQIGGAAQISDQHKAAFKIRLKHARRMDARFQKQVRDMPEFTAFFPAAAHRRQSALGRAGRRWPPGGSGARPHRCGWFRLNQGQEDKAGSQARRAVARRAYD